MTKLCWRHSLRLFWAAWSTLLDLSGKVYMRWSRKILADAHQCERCLTLSAKKPRTR